MIKANWIKVFASQAMHQNVLMPLYGDYMREPIFHIHILYIEIGIRCEFECERGRETESGRATGGDKANIQSEFKRYFDSNGKTQCDCLSE